MREETTNPASLARLSAVRGDALKITLLAKKLQITPYNSLITTLPSVAAAQLSARFLDLKVVGPKDLAPKGLEDSAQGFNPGNHRPERFALKGRQTERTNNAKVGPIVARLNCAL
jgi:hypothetical protein